MKRLLVLVAFALLFAAMGCGGDKDRNINSHKDMPRTATNED
jgi:hypothetical protein